MIKSTLGISLIFSMFIGHQRAAADERSTWPLHPSMAENFPEIQRRKSWQPVQICEDGRVVVDSVVTRGGVSRVDPNDPIYYRPFGTYLSESDLTRWDMQIVIKDKELIQALDAYTQKDGIATYFYRTNWDLLKDGRPVSDASEADELIFRGNNFERIWSVGDAKKIAFGINLPYYRYASEGKTFFKSQTTSPYQRTSRAAVYWDRDKLKLSLWVFYPFEEIANYSFDKCRNP